MIATQAKNSRCIDNFMDGARFSEQSTTQWMANEDQYGTHTHTANVAFEMSKKVKNHFFCGWSERKRNELRIGRKLGNGRGRRSNMRETNYAKFNRACPVHLLICPFVQYRRGKGQRCVLCCASEQNSFFFGHFRKWKTHQSDIWWETQLPDCVSVGLRSNSYTFASSHHSCIRAFVHCPLDTGEEMSITHAKNKFPSPKTSSAYINVSYPFNVKIVHCWKPSKPTQKHCFFLFCFHSVPKGCRLYTNAQGQQPNMYEYKHYQFQGSHKYATIRCFTVTIRSSECAALACVVFLSFPPTDISWPFQNVIIICMCWSSLCM